MRYYKFVRDAFFSAGRGEAFVDDVFSYNEISRRGRFRGFDFQVPVEYVDNLENLNITELITFQALMVLLGFPDPSELYTPEQIAEAIMSNPSYISALADEVAVSLKADAGFLADVEGDDGPTGPTGTGDTGPTGDPGVSDPDDVANILKGDTGFLDSVEGPTGPTGPTGPELAGPTGPSGPIGPQGLSFGLTAIESVELASGDIQITAGTDFEAVPGMEVEVTTVGAQERLMVTVVAVGYIVTLPQGNVGVERPLSLDLEVDGNRYGGSLGGIMLGGIKYPDDEVNLSFAMPIGPVLAGDHTIKLMWKGIPDGVAALRAHSTTNKLRMFVARY